MAIPLPPSAAAQSNVPQQVEQKKDDTVEFLKKSGKKHIYVVLDVSGKILAQGTDYWKIAAWYKARKAKTRLGGDRVVWGKEAVETLVVTKEQAVIKVVKQLCQSKIGDSFDSSYNQIVNTEMALKAEQGNLKSIIKNPNLEIQKNLDRAGIEIDNLEKSLDKKKAIAEELNWRKEQLGTTENILVNYDELMTFLNENREEFTDEFYEKTCKQIAELAIKRSLERLNPADQIRTCVEILDRFSKLNVASEGLVDQVKKRFDASFAVWLSVTSSLPIQNQIALYREQARFLKPRENRLGEVRVKECLENLTMTAKSLLEKSLSDVTASGDIDKMKSVYEEYRQFRSSFLAMGIEKEFDRILDGFKAKELEIRVTRMVDRAINNAIETQDPNAMLQLYKRFLDPDLQREVAKILPELISSKLQLLKESICDFEIALLEAEQKHFDSESGSLTSVRSSPEKSAKEAQKKLEGLIQEEARVSGEIAEERNQIADKITLYKHVLNADFAETSEEHLSMQHEEFQREMDTWIIAFKEARNRKETLLGGYDPTNFKNIEDSINRLIKYRKQSRENFRKPLDQLPEAFEVTLKYLREGLNPSQLRDCLRVLNTKGQEAIQKELSSKPAENLPKEKPKSTLEEFTEGFKREWNESVFAIKAAVAPEKAHTELDPALSMLKAKFQQMKERFIKPFTQEQFQEHHSQAKLQLQVLERSLRDWDKNLAQLKRESDKAESEILKMSPSLQKIYNLYNITRRKTVEQLQKLQNVRREIVNTRNQLSLDRDLGISRRKAVQSRDKIAQIHRIKGQQLSLAQLSQLHENTQFFLASIR